MNNPEPDLSGSIRPSWTDWLCSQQLADLFDIHSGSDHPFDSQIWEPGIADQKAAWSFLTELRTRVTTQPLPYYAGNEETALNSVFKLFEISRDIIKNNFGCTHFATLTVWILNREVRPFTAKWHRQSTDGRLASADVRFEFRNDLTELQPKLRTFTQLLAHLAGDRSQLQMESLVPREEEETSDPLWIDMDFGIGPTTSGIEIQRKDINAAEAAEIRSRRAFYECENTDEPINGVGLAISGGGIRSATFALGVIQQLARKGILQQVDFMSTVSGGGYIGGFLSSILNTGDPQATLKPHAMSQPFGKKGDGESLGARQLRNHSKYLAEGGFRTIATITALVAYGLLVSLLLFAPVLLLVTTIAARFIGPEGTIDGKLLWSFTTSKFIFVPFVAAIVLPLLQRLPRDNPLRRGWEQLCVVSAGLLLILLATSGLIALFNTTLIQTSADLLLKATLAYPLIVGVIALWLGPNTIGGKITFGLFALFGPLLLIVVCFALLKWLPPLHQNIEWILPLATLISLLYATLVLNINSASPHGFYRNRLTRTYMIRTESGTVDSVDPQPLSKMNTHARSPYHLINCAINVPSSKNPNLRGRNTDFFLFSKHYCGSPITGMQPTACWESNDPHLDLGTAIAISGAAAAPHMGTLTSPRYTFLLAMLNVRLGYWLRRPDKQTGLIGKILRVPSLEYYLREITGLMSEKSAYINLSDGGHIENLGVYELLRRRCKFVIAIDGEADPQRSFGGLLTLTQLAKIDLGIDIAPDLSDLRIDTHGRGRSHFGLARIHYPGGGQGLLLYIKSSLTGNESEFLCKYRNENPDFPHQSTVQQLFSETQFEAYRELGEHIAQDLFRKDFIKNPDEKLTVKSWFQGLSRSFLPRALS